MMKVVRDSRWQKVGVQFMCGCTKYDDGTIVRCNEHEKEGRE